MKIAHVLLSRGFAGTERATAEMCNAHCAQHEVLLLLRRRHRGAGGASIRDNLDARVRVVEVGDWWPGAVLADALRHFHPDVIHAHLRRSTRLLARLRPAAATLATVRPRTALVHINSHHRRADRFRGRHDGIGISIQQSAIRNRGRRGCGLTIQGVEFIRHRPYFKIFVGNSHNHVPLQRAANTIDQKSNLSNRC